MGAFVVNPKHINTLVTWGAQKNLDYFVGDSYEPHKFVGHEQEIATILMAENVRSVNYRYHEADEPAPIRYKLEWMVTIHGDNKAACQILKACQCYEYQACETNDWEDTPACCIIKALRARAINIVIDDPTLQYEIR